MSSCQTLVKYHLHEQWSAFHKSTENTKFGMALPRKNVCPAPCLFHWRPPKVQNDLRTETEHYYFLPPKMAEMLEAIACSETNQ
jgi:hypothetical protein